jgi:hypothetical protein
LENKKKAIVDSPKSALKRKNIVEEGGASGLRMKKEHESTTTRAHKMMRGRMEPSTMPSVVQSMPIMVHATR